MRSEYQRRTGAFGPEDPWFEARARAFWDDALTTQGFANAALDRAQRSRGAGDADGEGAPRHSSTTATGLFVDSLERAHRGFFVALEVDDRESVLLDVWSGAELVIQHLDETQALTLEHAEGGFDGRVVRGFSNASEASPPSPSLFLLPGAYHHPADALDPAIDVLRAARERGMNTQQALDALMRMELVFRSSSRVKAGFAYRVESLGRIEANAPQA